MEISVEISAALADARDKVVSETLAVLERRDQASRDAFSPADGRRDALSPADRRRDVQQLFELVQRCVHEGHAEPIITPSQQIAADRFVAGIDLAEVQAAFAALEDVLWRHLARTVSAGQQLETLRLVNVILGAGRDALARAYVSLAGRSGETATAGTPAALATPAAVGTPATMGTPGHHGQRPAAAGATGRTSSAEDAVVRTAVRGQVGVITLDDRRKRNAIGARMANGIIAALDSLRAQNARTVVIRAAPGMPVWSAGHDIDELPQRAARPAGVRRPPGRTAPRDPHLPGAGAGHGARHGMGRGARSGAQQQPRHRGRDGGVRHHPRKPGAAVQHDGAAALRRAAAHQPRQGDVLHRRAAGRAEGQGMDAHQPPGGGGRTRDGDLRAGRERWRRSRRWRWRSSRSSSGS